VQRERKWSQPGAWLYEDCPPAIRAVRLHAGVTASAIFACEAPPHVVRKRLCWYKVLRMKCVRGMGAGRERLRSRPGEWLCEDCPPAVRTVRLRTGVTASARDA
jgi:hypothetical protein